MTNPQTSELCQRCIEALTGPEASLNNPETQAHLASCSSCARILTTIEHLRQEGSAFACESHPDLKLRIMRSLEPALEKRRASQITAGMTQTRSWFWLLSSCLTLLLITVISLYTVNRQPILTPPEPLGHLTASVPASFMMTVDGKTPAEISLDSPVSLFTGETAVITVPDGSLLHVKGPARLNVLPRGFHLLQGHIRVEAAPADTEFKGTTPHGTITVIGTVFSVFTDQRHTRVEVSSGRVRVDADGQMPVILNAGENTEICPDGPSTETEIIPEIDNE